MQIRFSSSLSKYNIAIRIDEYRDGLLLNSIIRDMQILVRACNSTPPIIEVVDEICVVAGDSIDLEVRIDDLDINARVSLFASGGPFVQDTSSAQLLKDGVTSYEELLRFQNNQDANL